MLINNEEIFQSLLEYSDLSLSREDVSALRELTPFLVEYGKKREDGNLIEESVPGIILEAACEFFLIPEGYFGTPVINDEVRRESIDALIGMSRSNSLILERGPVVLKFNDIEILMEYSEQTNLTCSSGAIEIYFKMDGEFLGRYIAGGVPRQIDGRYGFDIEFVQPLIIKDGDRSFFEDIKGVKSCAETVYWYRQVSNYSSKAVKKFMNGKGLFTQHKFALLLASAYLQSAGMEDIRAVTHDKQFCNDESDTVHFDKLLSNYFYQIPMDRKVGWQMPNDQSIPDQVMGRVPEKMVSLLRQLYY